jgi:hypothetical protein
MVVAVGLSTAGIVERNALIVAQGRTAGSLVAVFVNALGPDARKVGQFQDWSTLGENCPASHEQEQKRKEAHGTP